MKKSRMRKGLFGVVIAVLSTAGCFIGWKFYETMTKSDQMQFDDIAMRDVKDGVYEGECETGLVQVKVRVNVKSHKIDDIRLLKHIHGLGGDAEVITTDIKIQNRLDVDEVSGATVSSRTIRKACENALRKGIK